MGIKNYTTQIKAEKTIMEIEMLLAKAGCSHIIKSYDCKGQPNAIGFKLIINNELVVFKLPMKLSNTLTALKKGNVPQRLINEEQAYRVGWRIIKDWVASQMALIEIELAKPQEVFLPYMYDENTNKTIYEKLEEKGSKFLLSSD